ncbi:LytR/AlgR family response regulator transcription factor [Petrachloros mirabilis]
MAQGTPHMTAQTALDRQRIRTVIVDDSPMFLDRALRWLKKEPGMEVVGQATSGDEALRQVQSLHPDLVIIDLAMAGLNGIQTAKKMKQEKDPPAVILMSVHDLQAFRKHWIGQVDGVIGKNDFAVDLPGLLKSIFPNRVSSGKTSSLL